MFKIVILGAAAGGGVPQWNCGCANCNTARADASQRATQASISLSVDDAHWFIVNASPDLRQQITDNCVLHPKPGALRHSPIAGVILTNGEVDAIAGLLSLREGWAFRLYAHDRVLSILAENSIFNVLAPDKVNRIAMPLDEAFELSLPDGSPAGIDVLAFAAPGKTALFLEGQSEEQAGDTVGLRFTDRREGKSFVFLAACARVTPEVERQLDGASLVFFDGTLWRDDEMILAGLSAKTGQRMGHISMRDAMPALGHIDIGRKVFLHINNSNPALRHGSPERANAEAAGWHIPADGMEIVL